MFASNDDNMCVNETLVEIVVGHPFHFIYSTPNTSKHFIIIQFVLINANMPGQATQAEKIVG